MEIEDACAVRILIQVNADNVVGFKLIRDCAITQAGDHGRQSFALLHEIFGADWVIEALTESKVAELDTATGRMNSHALGWFDWALYQ
jgi:hypothetical protein